MYGRGLSRLEDYLTVTEPPAVDLLDSGSRCLVDNNVHLDGDFAVAQNLHELVLTNGTLSNQCLDGDVATVGEQFLDAVQVNNLVLGAEGVLEAAQLRQAHVQRQLTAFEACTNLVTCLGTLGTATCGLTLGAFTAVTRVFALWAPGAGRRS